MKLNHINLVVSDVANAIALFCTYFNFTCTEVKGDNAIAILNGTDDFTLVIMKSKNGPAIYPDAFHIGFMLPGTNEVTAMHKSLQEGGVAVGEEPSRIRDGFGFYFRFENILIEVGHHLPDTL